jgi:hypothetical protein
MTPPFSKTRTEVVSSAKSSRLRVLSEGRAPVATTRASCATALRWGDGVALAEGEPFERPMSTAEATQIVPCALGLGQRSCEFEKVEAVKNRPRDGSNDNLFLQAELLVAIVQTYWLYEGASAGNVLCADYRCRRTENSEIVKPRAAPRNTSDGKWA